MYFDKTIQLQGVYNAICIIDRHKKHIKDVDYDEQFLKESKICGH